MADGDEIDELESVFKALADSNRRILLDRLAERDGQTLSSLVEALPDMTRFGVMKHLKVLEEAHLIVTEKAGREKWHYLNPVPIRRIHERWISRFTETNAAVLLELQSISEGA